MQDKCQPALDVFTAKGCTIRSFDTLQAACEALEKAETKPDLAILDESEGRQDPTTMRKAVMELMRINAFTYVTAMTSFDAEVYHDAMEGLGMLTALPCPAKTEDGEMLWAEVVNFVSTDIDHKA